MSNYYHHTSNVIGAEKSSEKAISDIEWYGSVSFAETQFYAQFNSSATTTSKQLYEGPFITWLNAFEIASNVIELRAYFGSSTNPTYTITDTNYIQGLQAAITSGSNYGSGTTSDWFMGWSCGSPSTVSSFFRNGNDNPSFHFGNNNACQCDSAAVIRPLIGNSNWGGVSGGCSQPTQSMGLGFIGQV